MHMYLMQVVILIYVFLVFFPPFLLTEFTMKITIISHNNNVSLYLDDYKRIDK